jgi:hypothetical protein
MDVASARVRVSYTDVSTQRVTAGNAIEYAYLEEADSGSG